MRFARCLLCLTMLMSLSALSQSQTKPCDGCSVVQAAMTAYEKLKPGMTRAELEQNFRRDGGFSGPSFQIYVFKDCSGIKVDVGFELPASPAQYFEPDNKIQSVGRLYVDHEVFD